MKFLNILFIMFNRLLSMKQGENNIVNVDKNVNLKYSIKGSNNKVQIFSGEGKKINITLKIKGNNNCVTLKGFKKCKRLYIDIGNLAGCNDVTIDIGKNFICVDTTILAYQNNVPISIGDDCLFSKGVLIRSGELPHRIFDTETGENLDNSTGIRIGNHVWIGENVYIMKKVQIQDDSIVGTASVVTRKFTEKNVAIAGNPAVICRKNISWK